jgi:hypothetical protein
MNIKRIFENKDAVYCFEYSGYRLLRILNGKRTHDIFPSSDGCKATIERDAYSEEEDLPNAYQDNKFILDLPVYRSCYQSPNNFYSPKDGPLSKKQILEILTDPEILKVQE